MSLLVMLTTAAGGIFFKEFAATTFGSNVAYGCGGLLAISGLAILGHAAAQTTRSKGEVQGLLSARRASSMIGELGQSAPADTCIYIRVGICLSAGYETGSTSARTGPRQGVATYV